MGPEKFMQPEIFVPMANEASLDGVNWLESRSEKERVFPIARIKDGITKAQVQADLNTIAARITRQYPKDEEKLAFKLARPGLIGDFVGGAVRRFLGGIMLLAGIVLLAACANLGGLFAARTADRTREIAIRMAIGSSRWRILRQVLMEAFVISILGGACACGLAWMALTGLARWHPPTDYPMKFLVAPQPSLILMAFLISVLACVLFGVMPLRQIFKADPNDAIKGGRKPSQLPGRRWALRDVLLAAQIALCCVTVTAAFVSMRGMIKSLTVDKGFNPKQRCADEIRSERGWLFRRGRGTSSAPAAGKGVAATGSGSGRLREYHAPRRHRRTSPVFSQQTTDFRDSNKAFDTYFFDVSPGYFAAAQTPLLAGRDFSFNDKANTPAGGHCESAVCPQSFPLRPGCRPLLQGQLRQVDPDRGHGAHGKVFSAQRRSAGGSVLPHPAEANYLRRISSSATGQIPPGWPRPIWQPRFAKWFTISILAFPSGSRPTGPARWH